jgi:subtilisin family serine protease
MTVYDERGYGPRSRLEAQIELVLHGIRGGDGGLPDAAAWPPDWAELNRVDYLYRERSLLVRDSDIDRVREIVPSQVVQRDDNMRGLTLLEFTEEETRSVEEVCAALDRTLGEGVATPDHIFYICPDTTCPATEPEPIPGGSPPDPGVSTDPCDGQGVLVAVLDSGWLPIAATQHFWLAGVTGETEDPYGGDPVRIKPYSGHGTFVAGVVRTMAPKADVWVSQTFIKVGAAYESFLVKKVADALKLGAEVISLDFGTNTRKDIPSLGFEIVREQLENYPSVVLVAAAGNDASRRPFWPAAYPWTVGVGALSANWHSRAYFSDYGSWVDVFAPGEGLINAFASGSYQCDEPPNTGQWRTFDGMCRWSGTSFSTPIVSGLIAARISGTGENGPQAAAALLAQAQAQAVPGIGPVIFPGQACSGQAGHGHGSSPGQCGGGYHGCDCCGGCGCGCRGDCGHGGGHRGRGPRDAERRVELALRFKAPRDFWPRRLPGWRPGG